ncbi:MAG: phasin family protein, partial [Cycloclasticus sp.]
MKDDLIKQWAQLSKKAQDSLKKMNTLNTASLKKLTKLQMEMVSSCLEGGVEKAKSIGKATSISDLMDMQSTLYKDLSEKVLKNAQSSVKVAMETKQAMGDLIKEGLFAAPTMDVKTDVKSKVKKTSVKKTAAKPA